MSQLEQDVGTTGCRVVAFYSEKNLIKKIHIVETKQKGKK